MPAMQGLKQPYIAPSTRTVPLRLELGFLVSNGGNEGFENPDED